MKTRRRTRVGTFLGVSVLAATPALLRCANSWKKTRSAVHSPLAQNSLGGRILNGGYENENSEEEEEEVSPEMLSATILVIFLLLIVLTIGFDLAKEHIEERAGGHLRPIIASLFGELTILGFLSACTFVMSEAGVFRAIGNGILGPEEEELLEIFELVHFTLFFVMLVFVIQVVEDVRESASTIEEWMDLDRACRDKQFIVNLLQQKYELEKERKIRKGKWGIMGIWERIAPYVLFLPELRHMALKSERVDDQLLFVGLRKEFVLDRSVDPPFNPAVDRLSSVGDFNFGRYLALCLGRNMSHVVEIDVMTWSVIALFGVLMYVAFILVEGNMLIMSWLWVCLGYIVFLCNIKLEKYLGRVRLEFTAPLEGLHPDKIIHSNILQAPAFVSGSLRNLMVHDENKEPLSGSGSFTVSNATFIDEVGDLPGWCTVDLEEYDRKRPWICRVLSEKGYQPSRQDTLFRLEKWGPEYHSFILRVNLVFNGLYCALLAVIFMPAMWKQLTVQVFVAYVIAAAVPILAILFNRQHLVLLMVQVGCIGQFRLPQLITKAQREEKTARAVRRLVIFHKLHLAATQEGAHGQGGVKSSAAEMARLPELNRFLTKEVSDMFDVFDKDGDGEMTGDEFRAIVGALGTSMGDDEVRTFLTNMCLGSENKDIISKKAFVDWYRSFLGKDDEGVMHDCANYLFTIFDQDNSGSVSVSELKQALDGLKAGFSVDEAGDILNELDIHERGIIGRHEVFMFLETYYPRELEKREESWGKSLASRLGFAPLPEDTNIV